jgi:haloacid dehalogenase superfamily, subfamily IA, variant 1 with third motif having Dx(3-4)D or Dx(3-4)E
VALLPNVVAILKTMAIKALFFDVGNTLLFLNRSKALRSLHARNIFPSEEQLRTIERQTKLHFDSLIEANSSIDHGFWNIYYSSLSEELGLTDKAVSSDLVACTRISANWCDIRPHTRDALLRLGESYRMGVISNADGKIAAVLASCGIADCFESITDSGIVGKEKPHPAIFEAALQSLRVRPEESFYVGDIYSVDYVGATSVGMHAVLFDVAGVYKEQGVPRVESMEQLEAWLKQRDLPR